MSEFYTSNTNGDIIEYRDIYLMIHRGIIKAIPPKLILNIMQRSPVNSKQAQRVTKRLSFKEHQISNIMYNLGISCA